MKKEKFLRTKEDIRQNNRVLRIANSTHRVFVVFTSREFNHPFRGQGGVIFVKRGREYNPAFDCDFWPERPSPARNRKPEYGKTLQSYIDDGFNLRFAGYPGDRKDAFWNKSTDLVVISRLKER